MYMCMYIVIWHMYVCMYIVKWHMYVCMYIVIWHMYVCMYMAYVCVHVYRYMAYVCVHVYRYMAYKDYLSSHVLLLQLLMFSHHLVRCVLGAQPLPVAAEIVMYWNGLMTVCL